jgi:HicB-like protein involved in pilus formation
MRTSNFALRLQQSLLEELRAVAAREGVAVNQFINVAIAEKLAQVRTVRFFAERTSRGNRKAGERLLRDLSRGGHEPPRPGDEISPERVQAAPAPRRHR